MTNEPGPVGWADYKAAWELAGDARSVTALQQLVQQLPQRETALRSLEDPRLLEDLVALVRQRAADRRRAIAPPRGEPPGPDWPAELRASMGQLERAHRVLDRLRRLGWMDPWIEARFAPNAAFLADVVSDQAGQVELEQGKATELVLAARALLTRVKLSLPARPR